MQISSSYWGLSEKMLMTIVPMMIIISCIIIFVLIGVFLEHTKKILVIFIIGITTLNVGISLFTLNYTRNYRRLEDYATYKNREYKPSILSKTSYSNRDIKGFSSEDIITTSQLPFYSIKESEEKNKLSYLGKDADLYFFKDNQENIVFNLETTSDLVKFSSNMDGDTIITIKSAELNDKSFSKYGFKEKVGPAITKILINKNLKDTYYRHTSPTQKLVRD